MILTRGNYPQREIRVLGRRLPRAGVLINHGISRKETFLPNHDIVDGIRSRSAEDAEPKVAERMALWK